MKFEWDEEKNARNIRDHKISFEAAIQIFLDPNRIERPDLSVNNNSLENRWQTIGKAEGILFVVFEEKIGDHYRIISARPADKNERRIYNGYSNDGTNLWSYADKRTKERAARSFKAAC